MASAEPAQQDTIMQSPAPLEPTADSEPRFGGFTRFEIELEVRNVAEALACPRCARAATMVNPTRTAHLLTLKPLLFAPSFSQFVQCLANPYYLNHLAALKLLSQPAFVAYLRYLQYWSRPPYVKYLTYPGPTLRHLELLQHERFRKDIISPDLAQRLVDDGVNTTLEWHREG